MHFLHLKSRFARNASFHPYGFVFQLIYGKGAGYLGGVTIFAAFNCGRSNFGGRGADRPTRSLLQAPIRIGFTRNANRVPYTSN